MISIKELTSYILHLQPKLTYEEAKVKALKCEEWIMKRRRPEKLWQPPK